MKHALFLIMLGVFSLGSLTSSAQYKRKTQKYADALFAAKDYYNAAIYYKKLLDIDSSGAKVNYDYAQALRLSNYNDKALYYYQVAYRKDRGKEFPDALYWIAELYKYQLKYTKAKRYFKRAERYYRGRKSTYFYAKVKKEQEACALALKLYNNPTDVTVVNIGKGVNTVHSEISPYMINDTTMVFSSLRPERDVSTDSTQYSIRFYKGLFAHGTNNSWKTSKDGLEVISFEDYNVSNGALDTRKNKFYFTVCSDTGVCEIFMSIYRDEVWGEPKRLGNKINMDGYTSTQPKLGKINGDEVLFFVSDRPGGYGQLDIWYSKVYSNGVFTEPKNAGKNINTLGNEITPYFHSPSGTLFFSSDWHNGLGGFDIFSSVRDENGFNPTKNLGYPINSSVNDYYFNIHDDGVAKLSSNRIGSFTDKSLTCCNDIYSFPYEVEIPQKKTSKELAYDSLVAYLPLRLFFHNDEPNPRSTKTTTDKNYMTTYDKYVLLIDRYKDEYSKGLKGEEKLDAKDEIADFFDLQVVEGAENLQKFSALLLRELNKGRAIELTVKGFASPLSKSDYNANLTQRRIMSIENFFNQFDQGAFRSFIQKGQLVIKQEPFGEDRSAGNVSDNINDKRNSIYSKKAAFERRVEIISVNLN